MINVPFDQISKEDIKGLVQNEVAEGLTLDYKEELPGNGRDDKKEFLLDVTSFANAVGGDLIYGVSDKRDEHGKPTGIPEEAKGLADINPDGVLLRLREMILSGIEPRIHGIRTKFIADFRDGPILIVRIPRSILSPHWVSFGPNARYFCSRHSSGKYHLSHMEIRSAFFLSGDIAERIRDFRADRLAKIVASETPVVLNDGAKVILHMLPINALDAGNVLDLHELYKGWQNLQPMPCSGCNRPSYNFDGLCTSSKNRNSRDFYSYVQVFRNSALEAVSARLLSNAEKKIIPSIAIEKYLMEALNSYLKYFQSVDIGPPMFIMLSLLGVRDYVMSVRSSFGDSIPIDRDSLILPDIIVEDFDRPPDRILRPVFDAIWQACGFEGSWNYDEDGNWREHSG